MVPLSSSMKNISKKKGDGRSLPSRLALLVSSRAPLALLLSF